MCLSLHSCFNVVCKGQQEREAVHLPVDEQGVDCKGLSLSGRTESDKLPFGVPCI
jgi:hypothetical protein